MMLPILIPGDKSNFFSRRYLRSCPECYKRKHKRVKISVQNVAIQKKIELCRDLGLEFSTDPVDFVLGAKVLGIPSKPERKSEGYGQCLFSSIYFLLTGTKSSKKYLRSD